MRAMGGDFRQLFARDVKMRHQADIGEALISTFLAFMYSPNAAAFLPRREQTAY